MIARTLSAGPSKAGLAALFGGISAATYSIAAAGKPQGCLGDCLAQAPRDTGGLDLLLLLGIALIAGAFARLARPSRAGTIATLMGAGMMLVTLPAMDAIGDLAWYLLMMPGVLAVVAGMMINAVAATRASVIPRIVGTAFIAGALVLLAFNTEDDRVLFMLPIAITSAATGLTVLYRAIRSPVLAGTQLRGV
jgi:hypothetical protein